MGYFNTGALINAVLIIADQHANGCGLSLFLSFISEVSRAAQTCSWECAFSGPQKDY